MVYIGLGAGGGGGRKGRGWLPIPNLLARSIRGDDCVNVMSFVNFSLLCKALLISTFSKKFKV